MVVVTVVVVVTVAVAVADVPGTVATCGVGNLVPRDTSERL